MKKDFIPVLLGSDINVYGMASSFYKEYGKKSKAIGKGILPPCQNSNIVHVEVIEPNLEDDDIFTKTLLDFKNKYKDETLLLVPCGDNYTKMLVRNQDKLKDAYVFNCIDNDLLVSLNTKEKFYELCEKHNMPYPKTVVVTKENYKNISIPFDYPIIIKPSNSVMYWNAHFENKKKVFLAENEEEFNKILDAIYHSTYTDHLIIQEFIPGDDSKMRVVNCYSDHNGKVKMASFGKILLEECTPEGIGSYAVIISDYDKEILDLIINFLEKIGFKGYSNFDLKYDVRDNKYKLFEINPRQGRSSYYVTAAGCNLSKYLVDDMIYEKEMELDICKNKILYSIIPKKIIFKYVSDENLKEEAQTLINEHKIYNSFMCKGDNNLKRKLYFQYNQLTYYRKYKKYFGNKGLR